MSKIEWTEKTWNPIVGCTEVSPGCLNCYAVRQVNRIAGQERFKASYGDLTKTLPNGKQVWTGKLLLRPERLLEPFYRKTPTIYFVNTLSDLFHEDLDVNFVFQVFAMMLLCPQHTFQVLTKRASRMMGILLRHDWMTQIWQAVNELIKRFMIGDKVKTSACVDPHKYLIQTGGVLPNVWLGVSIENQNVIDRLGALIRTPAAKRFLSCEPLMGPVDLLRYVQKKDVNPATEDWLIITEPCLKSIDWVIVGGESGPNARPMHPRWAEDIRDACQALSIPFFFKQWGEFTPIAPEKGGLSPVVVDGGKGYTTMMYRIGKHAAGRVLNGQLYNEMPAGTHLTKLEDDI